MLSSAPALILKLDHFFSSECEGSDVTLVVGRLDPSLVAVLLCLIPRVWYSHVLTTVLCFFGRFL